MNSPIKSKDQIRFHFLTTVRLDERKKLRLFLQQLAVLEKKGLHSLDIIFCTDKYLVSINQQYLEHNDFTDIITFDLSGSEKGITGEIYISAERVKDNSKIFKTTFKAELHRVIFHGVLHLCGYKDKTPAEQKIMRKKEDQYLSKYFPYKLLKLTPDVPRETKQ